MTNNTWTFGTVAGDPLNTTVGLSSLLDATEKYDLMLLLSGAEGPAGLADRRALARVAIAQFSHMMTRHDFSNAAGVLLTRAQAEVHAGDKRANFPHDLISYGYSRATREGLLEPTQPMVSKWKHEAVCAASGSCANGVKCVTNGDIKGSGTLCTLRRRPGNVDLNKLGTYRVRLTELGWQRFRAIVREHTQERIFGKVQKNIVPAK